MKSTILTGILILISCMVFSQNKVDLGFRAGISTSKLYTDLDDYNKENIVGYQAGTFMRFFIKKRILIEPEVYFVKKGGELYQNDAGIENSINFDVNSVDVPLLFGFKLIELGFTRILVYTGPVMSFAYSNTVEFIENGQQDPLKSAEDLIRGTNWGFQLGGSLDVLMFTLDMRYEWGLNDIYEGDDVYRPNLFLIGLGVRVF